MNKIAKNRRFSNWTVGYGDERYSKGSFTPETGNDLVICSDWTVGYGVEACGKGSFSPHTTATQICTQIEPWAMFETGSTLTNNCMIIKNGYQCLRKGKKTLPMWTLMN